MAFALALLGIAIGLLAALLVTYLMTGLLYGVSAKGPLIFLAIPALLVGIEDVTGSGMP